jgi:hypothetical protein
MWEKALELASHITHPGTIALFTAVLAAYLLSLAIQKKQPHSTMILMILLAIVMLLLGLAPLLSSTYLQSRGLYQVRVIVLGTDEQPTDDARVTSSGGGEPKKIQGGWEFDIPPQSRSAEGKLTFFATVNNAFLSGRSSLVLGNNYFPTVDIQLGRDTSATIRGDVVDELRRSVVGANVSIMGYPDVTKTDQMGNFELPAHAAEGQVVQVRAQKGLFFGHLSAPAGKTPIELVISRH